MTAKCDIPLKMFSDFTCSLQWTVVLLFALTQALGSGSSENDNSSPKLMLFSFDGFGWNFLSKVAKTDIPGFQKFINQGVHVRWIENVFPSLTRTNHMSLVSGLYAESHGIVANHFYDSALNDSIPGAGHLMINDSKWVDVGAEPIWVTNSKAGGERRSGCILWPLADAKIKGILPEKQMRGSWSIDFDKFNRTDRVDLALKWLTDPNEPVNFVAVYFTEPDEISHHNGPDSQEVYDAILEYDKTMTYLLEQMEKKGLLGKVHVIVTADHGQMPAHVEDQVNIDRLVDRSWYHAQPYLDQPRTMINVWPVEGFYDRLIQKLKHRNLHVATKNSSELKALHYSESSRIAPIVAWAEPGWMIGTDQTIYSLRSKGQHGWDPRYAVNMYPFFIAIGPTFKKGLKDATPFSMVDIYPLMCHILGLKPAPNNGSLENVRHILNFEEATTKSSSTSYSEIAIGVIVTVLGVVAVVVILWKIRQGRNVSAAYKRSFVRVGNHDQLLQEGMVVLSDEEL